MRSSTVLLALAMFPLAACSAVSSPTPTPSGAVSGIASGAPPSPSSAPATSPSADPARPKINVVVTPSWTSLDEPAGNAPCDYARAFRGKVGETRVSVVLRRDAKDPAIVTGASHYDRESDAIVLRGKIDADAFALDESPGGSFKGTCDKATGKLTGTFTLGKTSSPFTLSPRPEGWPGMYTVTVEATGESHNPQCARVGKRDEPVALSDYEVCPPLDPAKRKAFYKDAPSAGCTLHDTSLRVFGLTDKAVEKKVNAALARTSGDVTSTHACRTTPQNIYLAAEVVDARAGLLVVTTFSSRDEGGMHPMNSKDTPTTIDLTTGDVVRLEDAVADLGKLKRPAAECVGLYGVFGGDAAPTEMPDVPELKCGEDGMGHFLWGCPDNLTPTLTIVGDGIIVAQSGNPHVSVALDGYGPLVPWSVLLREGVLPSDSPIKRLWRDVTPAPTTALACTSAYEGDTWRRWSIE